MPPRALALQALGWHDNVWVRAFAHSRSECLAGVTTINILYLNKNHCYITIIKIPPQEKIRMANVDNDEISPLLEMEKSPPITTHTSHDYCRFFSPRAKSIASITAGSLTLGTGVGLFVHYCADEPYGGSIEIAAGVATGFAALIFLGWYLMSLIKRATAENLQQYPTFGSFVCCA